MSRYGLIKPEVRTHFYVATQIGSWNKPKTKVGIFTLTSEMLNTLLCRLKPPVTDKQIRAQKQLASKTLGNDKNKNSKLVSLTTARLQLPPRLK